MSSTFAMARLEEDKEEDVLVWRMRGEVAPSVGVLGSVIVAVIGGARWRAVIIPITGSPVVEDVGSLLRDTRDVVHISAEAAATNLTTVLEAEGYSLDGLEQTKIGYYENMPAALLGARIRRIADRMS